MSGGSGEPRGDRVEERGADSSTGSAAGGLVAEHGRADGPQRAGALHVFDPGPLMLVEDAGRPGHAHLGVSPSGAADQSALALANRLVGNVESAAALEVVLGPFAVRFSAPTWFALAGAWGRAWLDDTPLDPYAPVLAGAGSRLRVEAAQRGLRYVLAVRGGLDVPLTLGSASTDTLAGLGPAPLTAGSEVVLGAAARYPVPEVDTSVIAAPASGCLDLRAHDGPRADWFTAASRERFYEQEWVVSADANRVGVALEPAAGAPIERVRDGELPSEAMFSGAVQVPPAGTPTVLLADHPVTGGYPVIAVVDAAGRDLLAQARPGQSVRFRRAP